MTETRGLDIGPHPHTELHTVTWVVAGEVLHRDSLGSERVIRAGQVKLMTAGEGVTDSEEATGRYRGQLYGVRLWNSRSDRSSRRPAAPSSPCHRSPSRHYAITAASRPGSASPASSPGR